MATLCAVIAVAVEYKFTATGGLLSGCVYLSVFPAFAVFSFCLRFDIESFRNVKFVIWLLHWVKRLPNLLLVVLFIGFVACAYCLYGSELGLKQNWIWLDRLRFYLILTGILVLGLLWSLLVVFALSKKIIPQNTDKPKAPAKHPGPDRDGEMSEGKPDTPTSYDQHLYWGNFILFFREGALAWFKALVFIAFVSGLIFPVFADRFEDHVWASKCHHITQELVRSTNIVVDESSLEAVKAKNVYVADLIEQYHVTECAKSEFVKQMPDRSFDLSKASILDTVKEIAWHAKQFEDAESHHQAREKEYFIASILFIEPPSHKWYWLLGLMVLFIIFLEYEWLIRPSRLVIEEPSLRRRILNEFNELPGYFFKSYPQNDDHKKDFKRLSRLKKRYRDFAEATLVNQIFQFLDPCDPPESQSGF